MTVCIAALCEDEEEQRVVIAADRMVTLGNFIEFEHAVPKMTAESPFAIAMIAGDTLAGNAITDAVASSTNTGTPPIDEIAGRLAGAYEGSRRGRLETNFLTPRGLDLASFYNAHASLNGQITALIDNQMQNYRLGVELLLAGVDGSGAHIYTIDNPGTASRHDIIGYAATGSGAIHAVQSLIGFGHCASAGYHETVFRVFASKRRAEVTPGVGSDTDVVVISPGGTQWLSADEIARLEQIYGDFESSTDESLKDRLASFSLAEPSDARHKVESSGD